MKNLRKTQLIGICLFASFFVILSGTTVFAANTTEIQTTNKTNR